MTTDPKERTTVRPRVPARLGALLVAGTLALLGAGVAQAAVPRVEEVTRAQVRQLLPLCPVAWSVTDTDPRLPVGLSRPVVLATCIQHFPQRTRLTPSSQTAPTVDTPVPPGADGRPVAPIEVHIVTRTPTTQPEVVPTPGPRPEVTPSPAPPVAFPVPIAVPVAVPVPVEVPVAVPVPVEVPAPTVMVGQAPAAVSDSPSTPGAASSGTTSGSVDGESATGGASGGSATEGAAGAVDTGTSADLFPAAAEVPAAPVEKASIFGLPGTVSDPAALAAQVAAATGSSAPFLLVVALVVLALVGLLLWWGLRGEDLSQRLRDLLARVPFVRRPATDGTGPDGGDDEVAPADLVDQWLHADDGVSVPSPREADEAPTARVPDVVV